MKKNFLVTTGLIDAWEFKENNFILGKWCEFYEFNDFDKKKFDNSILKKENIIKNKHHWEDNNKKVKDYAYLKNELENLLEIISEKLSKIHKVNDDKEYWRIIIFNWLNLYTTTLFERWENIKVFFDNNKEKNFFTNYFSLDDNDYIPENNFEFLKNTQKDDWNHIIYLRLLKFLNIENLTLIEKKISIKKFKKEIQNDYKTLSENSSIVAKTIYFIDSLISKFAFSFNKVILESFYFPKKEYLKICLRCKLIPSKYQSFFDYKPKEKKSFAIDVRIAFKDLLSETKIDNKFVKFLLDNLHKDMPKSYLENFAMIKKKYLPFSKQKKIILSMHSLFHNDNFKIYTAEAKKSGSKYIHIAHGGGLTQRILPYMDFFEKVSDQIIRWEIAEPNQNYFKNLSPTLSVAKLKVPKRGQDCSIIFCEDLKYILKIFTGPSLVGQSIDLFNDITKFVKGLNSEIKSNVKFRTKGNFSYDSKQRFSNIFGENAVSLTSFKNPFEKTILNSKLLILTYPYTVFSESMYSNVPTVLILKKNYWQMSKRSEDILNDLIKNKIVFDNFDEAKDHINKYWNNIDIWWKSENVQISRKRFLKNFFCVKPNWAQEWSDYIYFLKYNK